MTDGVHLALVGDPDESVAAHRAIPRALRLAGERLGVNVTWSWWPTDSLLARLGEIPDAADGWWCVPGSPYRDMAGVLEVLRRIRAGGVPFLGTCGGFQHTLIEFVRNELGRPEADHAESNPGAELAVIEPLACSLVGARGRVRLAPGSLAARCAGAESLEVRYHCRFGPGGLAVRLLAGGAMRITGWDEAGHARVVELPGHPFHLGTLFQPELASLETSDVSPLVTAFVATALAGRAV